MRYVQQIEENSAQSQQQYYEVPLQRTNTVPQPMLPPGSVPQVVQQWTSTIQPFPGPYLQLLSNNGPFKLPLHLIGVTPSPQE